MSSIQLLKDLQQKQDKDLYILFVDGFVSEIDEEDNSFCCNGEWISFDDVEEDDFEIYDQVSSELLDDDIRETVKTLNKIKKSLEKIQSFPRSIVTLFNGEEIITTLEVVDEFYSFNQVQDTPDVEVLTFRRV